MRKKKYFPKLFLFGFFILVNSGLQKVSAQCIENFDVVTAPALPTGWTAVTLLDCAGSNPWVTSTTSPYNGTNSVFIDGPGCISDEALVSGYYSITASNAQLYFLRKHNLETFYDGIVLEISIGGAPFVDIVAAGGTFINGGYSHLMSSQSGSPIAGRLAWSGSTSNSYFSSIVDLPASANGQIIVLRWRRATDSSNPSAGVYIDNVYIYGCTSNSPCEENFSTVTAPALPSTWSAVTAVDCATSNPWATISFVFASFPNSAFTNDPACVSDEYLHSRLFQIISPTAQLSFSRDIVLENGYDGLVLEISIGGSDFQDILLAGGVFVTGGYNGTIDNGFQSPIAGRAAWTGNTSGWLNTTVNLPASANGKNIVLRWRRATDLTVSGGGAYIDNITVSGSLCNNSCSAAITLDPPGGSLCNGIVQLTASGSNSVYAWYKNDVLINGETSSTYTAIEGGIYYVKSVVNGCTVTSNVAVLGQGAIPPSLGGTGVYCTGNSVSIGIPDTENEQDYTWLRNGSAVHYVPIGGGGGNQSLNFNMAANGAGTYIVESTRPGCTSVFSNYVYVGFAGITGLAIDNLCSNTATIKWNRVVQESVSQNYEWQISLSPTPGVANGQTADSFKVVTVNPSVQYYFHVRSACNFSSSFGNWSTIPFTTPSPVSNIVISPSSGTYCGNSILLTATGGSSPYEWYKDGVLISGETTSTYSAIFGGTYTAKSVVGQCRLGSNSSVITSDPVMPPQLNGEGAYCTGALVDLSVPNTVNAQSYTWLRNGSPAHNVPIGGGGGNQSLAFAMASNKSGMYYVETTKPGCPTVSSNSVYVNHGKVTGLTNDSYCATEVNFSWIPIAPDENYQYVVSRSATPPASPTAPFTQQTSATVDTLVPSILYYIHVRAASGPPGNMTSMCPEWTTISFTTPAATIPGNAEWKGTVNNAWSNPGNWKCGEVPGTISAVVIPVGMVNYPLITSNITVKSMDVAPGASVLVAPGVVVTIK